jgi:hypothetical protein
MAKQLTVEQKLALFESATRFRISEDIAIENRRKGNEFDRWAILNGGFCYYKNGDEWEYEPLPSNRDAVFMAKTRYPLAVALDIVNSDEFRRKYIKQK